jgi:aminodeoxyfutalosine deaminase
MTVFRARHVAPIAAPVIDDGCVLVRDGRIVAVGTYDQLGRPAVDHDADGVLLPGLINAHTHLELTNVPRPARPKSFQSWLLEGMTGAGDVSDYDFEGAVKCGVAQSLKFGVTCVGDISWQINVVRETLGETPIRAVSFGECRGLQGNRLEKALAYARSNLCQSPRVRIGLSPHAPYSVSEEGYRRVFGVAYASALPVTTHLAETADEAPFLRDHGGAFGEMYAELSAAFGIELTGEPPRWDKPVEMFVEKLKPRELPLLAAHMNVAMPQFFPLLAARKIAVVWCPRTHAYFGRGPHPWRAMRAAGMTVCVGTDSCASSPDLNVVDDLRLIYADDPTTPPAVLWRMVTADAADALRYAGETLGRIEAGAAADFAAFPTTSADPLREILESLEMRPSAVWVAGTPT